MDAQKKNNNNLETFVKISTMIRPSSQYMSLNLKTSKKKKLLSCITGFISKNGATYVKIAPKNNPHKNYRAVAFQINTDFKTKQTIMPSTKIQ